MMRESNLALILCFVLIVFLLQVGEAQHTTVDVKVGIVNYVGMAYTNMTFFCINMSLSDFYSSHPNTRTRLITTIVDSKNDVAIAAAGAEHDFVLKNVHQKTATRTTFSTWQDQLGPNIWPGDTTFIPIGWEIPTTIKRNMFLKSLKLKLWLTSLLSFFIIGFVVWVLEHRVNPEFNGHVKYQINTIF